MNRKQSRADKKRNKGGTTSVAIGDLFAQAIRHHREGRLKDAESLHLKILANDPRYAESLHMLALLGYETGRYALAAEMATKAIEVLGRQVPNKSTPAALRAEAHNILGHALWALRRLNEAEEGFRQAIERDPNFVEAHTSLGNVLWEQGKLDGAEQSYLCALALQADEVGAHIGLGNVLKDRGNPEEAMGCYRQALTLHSNLAEAHNNLGNALNDLGRLEEAIASYRQALVLKPELVQARNNIAVALWDQGKPEEAKVFFGQIHPKPSYLCHGFGQSCLSTFDAGRCRRGDECYLPVP